MLSTVYSYTSTAPLYSVSWSKRTDKPLRVAATSFVNQIRNVCQVFTIDDVNSKLIKSCEFEVEYPPTKVQFSPEQSTTKDLLVVGGLKPQILEIKNEVISSVATLGMVTDVPSPCSSLDWNCTKPDLLLTCSLDSTVTLWSVSSCNSIKKLIAHEKEVYDIAFSDNPDVFSTVGGDGSLRMFDLRSLEHSTILYETTNLVPLLRLSYNKFDSHFIATFSSDSTKVIVIDTRKPAVPYVELSQPHSLVNAVCWSPHCSTHLCSASSDQKALLWDLFPVESGGQPQMFQFQIDKQVNDISWCPLDKNLISFTAGNQVYVVEI
ncbi:protein TRANSPARENT TESTA GLABRA, putative [Entamoeba invadens IP1]|uniref:Protein TRANSPARENT TESTA GLABRA, putative n=1 Tax=Entamoeba invadens IP1 TaxID=370355 RepID=A0A0A1U8C9_ENTIV|nr:protein TRANSPARENT TESTA GLABRA, putative [Entamoeba invadens IP1]ELP88238.1 protein TRANSPARENT TESTA GLABRA, putative [Entamoeba invadens IP1]|eukprot:XP_004255009.1 protein TRANSPARENT TESTA GLABRA, putative [Entamoeba invadens IP1]